MSAAVRQQSSLDGVVKIAPNYVKQAVRWVVDRFHPLCEVEAESYREKMKSVHPSVDMLTSYRIRCEIQNLAASVRNKFKQKFHNAEAKVAITTDAWTGKDGNSYICLTVHFLSKAWELQSFCTGVLHCGVDGHGAKEYAAMLVSLLMQTGLRRDQIEAMVTDTESTMQKLGRFFEDEFQFHPCAAHTVDLTAKLMSTSEHTADLMAGIRKFVTKFTSSPNAQAALAARMRASGVRPLVLIQEVETRWWATYMCCLRLSELEEYINVDDMDMLVGEYLTPEHWEFIYQVVSIMEPFRNFQKFMEGQKHCTLPWLPVSLEQLRRHLENVASDLEDPNSNMRKRRGLRDQPGLMNRLRKVVQEMRESFIVHWRDRDEKFRCGASGEMRVSGIPPKAWFAALIDARTRTMLGFLSAAERTWLWSQFAEFTFDRFKDREAAEIANADPPP